ncbi:hypothetical protein BK816_03995 [Boudabousia tangfeifanii]|uniref:Uncharacterized protein n=1 Tax=Boudabousia tangfeifanii TaxID=1912795 RepID=A0A1D9MK64_9ACTO|nr:hypothetical protein [Boudabousia tangfeifanii]AOZ72560.1 hypothetical protein BK816_03995 [Boudabousia tangfeifanii]
MMQSMISIRDKNRSFEAHNLLATALPATVAAWFNEDNDPRVKKAIGDLSMGDQACAAALKFLGIEIISAA